MLVDQAPDAAVLTVKDSDRHREARIAARLERFYRADSSCTPEVGGASLGLALVNWLAERHQGSVDIVSDKGRGTVVTVRLPATLAKLAARAS